MKLLLSSHFFFPQVGGTETVGRILAEEFAAAGHEVKVVTQTLEPGSQQFPFEILRRPTPSELMEAVKWCDVYFHNNISLNTAWPLLLVRRPWVVTSHTWIPRLRDEGIRAGFFGGMKRLALRFAHRVSISRALAADFSTTSAVIPNPYQDNIFRLMPEVPRNEDLICVSRLVPGKGLELLVRALGTLRAQGMQPRLTIVGSGPEEVALLALAGQLRVGEQITFAGMRSGEELARLLNAHRIVVIPSLFAETFGLVALEGAACGCLVIGSDRGGLPEAIGPCGLTFSADNPDALAGQLARALNEPSLRTSLLENAPAHLERHHRRTIAAAYLELMSGLV